MARPLSLKIGVSGVRGVAGETLTPELVTSFAAAFGTWCGPGPIAIGSDSRPSREMVTQAAIAGLLSVGCTPVDLGIVPVPTLQLTTRAIAAAGAVCITASHNPAEWNALKFIGPDGIVLRQNHFAELLDIYHQGVFPRVGALEIPDLRRDDRAAARHREAVLGAVDVAAIRKRRLRVAIDCCNGAASLTAPEFLRALGCEVTEVHTDLNSPFPRDPEPLPAHIGALCDAVRAGAADLGFALDADADRVALVDATGNPLGEDCTIALALLHILARRPGPVVVSVATSRMVDDVAARFGCPVHRTRVGETHVVERMLALGSPIGGESNGGVIVPALNPCRDSFVAMALILEALTLEGTSLAEFRARIPSYALVKEKLPCRPRDIAPALRLLRYLHRGQEIDLTDGVKVIWPDRWLHVRGSSTEPILRVAAEAHSEDEARALVRNALEYLRPGTL